MEKETKQEFKEIRYQHMKDIKTKGRIDRIVLFKPVGAPIACIIMGIGLIALSLKIDNKWPLIVLGVFFILMALSVLFLVKDKKVCDVYSEGVLLYNPYDSNYAWFLDYDLVKEWGVNHVDGHDVISFTLTDLNKVGFDSFQADKAYKSINKFIPEKNEKVIKAKKSREKSLHFNNWIKDRINTIKKK